MFRESIVRFLIKIQYTNNSLSIYYKSSEQLWSDDLQRYRQPVTAQGRRSLKFLQKMIHKISLLNLPAVYGKLLFHQQLII